MSVDPRLALLDRAQAAASAAERHHCAYYVVEASLRLSVMVRLAAWRELGLDEAPLQPLMRALPRASMGGWLSGLRTLVKGLAEADHALGALPPVGEVFRPVADAALASDVVPRAVARQARKDLLGAFGFMVSYRNAVLGHGSWRDPVFYGQLGALWLDAARWIVRWEGCTDGPITLGEGGQVSLGDRSIPLCRWRTQPQLDRPQVGLLDRVVSRRGEIKRVDFLDYASGESFTTEAPGLEDWVVLSLEDAPEPVLEEASSRRPVVLATAGLLVALAAALTWAGRPVEQAHRWLTLTQGGWEAAHDAAGTYETRLIATRRFGRTVRLARTTDLGGPRPVMVVDDFLDVTTHLANLSEREPMRATTIEQEHDWRGRLAELRYLSFDGSELARERWTWEDGQTALAVRTTPEGAPTWVDDVFHWVRSPWRRYHFDEDGFLVEIEPVDADGARLTRSSLQVTPGPLGVPRAFRQVAVDGGLVDRGFAMRTTWEGGMNTSWTYLGAGETPAPGPKGCTTVAFDVEDGIHVTQRCLDGQGEPMEFNQLGCHALHVDRLPENAYAWVCLDAEDRPAPSAFGWSRMVVERDELGFVREVRAIDVEGEPTAVNGSGVHAYRLHHDALGRLVEVGPLLASDGAPMAIPALGFGDQRRYDDRGLLVERRMVDVEGMPWVHPSGYASVLLDNDGQGRRTQLRYFDPDGQPVQPSDEAHAVRWSYDGPSWDPVREVQLDTSLEPVISGELGVAETRWSWHGPGVMASRALYGPDGEPVRGPHRGFRQADRTTVSCHRMEREVDEQGRQVELRCLDPDGSLHAHEEGWAKILTSRDRASDGHAREVYRFFDAEGQPVWTAAGYARHEHHLDELGHQVEHLSWGPLGEPALEYGCHRRVMEVSPAGWPLRERCFGLTDAPAVGLDSGACAETLATFAPNGQWLSHRCLDTDGNLTAVADGVAYRERTADAAGRIVDERFFGTDGEPAVNLVRGVARLETSYDAAERPLVVTGWASDGSPGVMPAPPNGLPLSGHRYTISYSPQSREDVILATGPDGAPMPVAQVELSFDEAGFLDGFAYRDPDGQPVLGPPGYARLVVPNESGTDRASARMTLDAEGRPIPQDGCLRLRYVYESETETTHCEDAHGVPTTGTGGWATKVISQGWDGQVQGVRWFDAAGAPIAGPGGPASEERSYYLGRLVEVAWFQADGSPMPGVAREVLSRDRHGREERRHLEGPDGQLVPYGPGCTAQVTERDAAGHEQTHCSTG